MKQHSRQIRNIVLLTSSLMLATIGVLSCSYEIVLEGGNCLPACDEGKICENGICVYKCDPECDEGLECCGQECVDLNSNENCGSCGNVCADGEECRDSKCQCVIGYMTCESGCVDLKTDKENCGSCGNACSVFQECKEGECQCINDYEPCESGCVNLQTDLQNCGACGNACGDNQACVDGHCQCTDSYMLLCNLQCVERDMQHCGACDAVCNEETEICNSVSCLPKPKMDNCDSSCNPNQDCCNGECIDPNSYDSKENCGQCGFKCEDSFECIDKKCQCQSDRKLCGNECVNLNNTKKHCGACNHACGEQQACENGECKCHGENEGKTACGELCIDLSVDDKNNCGICGNICGDEQLCCGGQCIDMNVDREHCGACENRCSDVLVCRDGACQCSESNELYCHLDCIEKDDNNCGVCDKNCGSHGTCEENKNFCICESGYTDCDTGCVSLRDDANNCGVCGHVCGEGQKCENGECLCSDDKSDLCGEGCVDLSLDNNNCGFCNSGCGESVPYCYNGLCAVSAEDTTFNHAYLTCQSGMIPGNNGQSPACYIEFFEVGKHFLVLEPGKYLFEVDGAEGGDFTDTPDGKGGYSRGTISLTEKTPIFVHVGGRGTKCSSENLDCGGYNGGGNGGYTGGYSGYGGGGATDIRIKEDTIYHRVIVAGGGGGADDENGKYETGFGSWKVTHNDGAGGAGGGAGGGNASCNKKESSSISGGQQTGEDVFFGMGESVHVSVDLGGGGGGWFGGRVATEGNCGGGGGSGFIFDDSNESKLAVQALGDKYQLADKYKLKNTNSKSGRSSGDGHAKITFLSNNPE